MGEDGSCTYPQFVICGEGGDKNPVHFLSSGVYFFQIVRLFNLAFPAISVFYSFYGFGVFINHFG